MRDSPGATITLDGDPPTVVMGRPTGTVAGAIITYQLPRMNSSCRTRFSESVLGQVRKAGERTCRRRGSLDALPHWKVNRGVIVVRAED